MSIRFRRPFATIGMLVFVLSACAGRDSVQLVPDSTAVPEQTAQPAHGDWYDDVMAISAHAGSDPRRGALASRLAASGLAPDEIAFTARDLQGRNLLATVSGDASAPLLLVGAHYDQVETGDGVTDNASGSAVVLALARRFQQQPLRHHRVAVAFWDLEEKGLLGANAYVTEGGERPALYVNFDVFGWGDTLWMMAPDATHPLVLASDKAAQAHGILLSAGDKYPPTDHLAFLKGGWPAVSYSLVGRDEITPILQMFSGGKPTHMPKVMEVIHTPDDTLSQVDAAAVETAIDAVEAALRAWDAGHGAN